MKAIEGSSMQHTFYTKHMKWTWRIDSLSYAWVEYMRQGLLMVGESFVEIVE